MSVPSRVTVHLIERRALSRGALALIGSVLATSRGRGREAGAEVNESAVIKQLTGGVAALSPLVHLDMPPVFGNGYSVPMSLSVDSPMTESDHVRVVHVLAPRNPIVVVANYQFTPRSGRAAITTRIRLSEPQAVLAVAEMSSGALLMARSWVKVDINGCN